MPFKKKEFLPKEASEKRLYVRGLINEFRKVLAEEKYEPSAEADNIMVLSGPSSAGEEYGGGQENYARISYAAQVLKQIIGKRLGKNEEEIGATDLLDPQAPRFVLNGETEQLPAMKNIALELGMPEEKIYLLDCGPSGKANTKTQFTSMLKDANLKNTKNIVIVSSGYHTPRISRTAEKELPQEIHFEAIGVPHDKFSFNVFRKVKGEVKRIIAYNEKGDIAKYLPSEE